MLCEIRLPVGLTATPLVAGIAIFGEWLLTISKLARILAGQLAYCLTQFMLATSVDVL